MYELRAFALQEQVPGAVAALVALPGVSHVVLAGRTADDDKTLITAEVWPTGMLTLPLEAT